jgi:hypothetical protein
MDINDKGRMKHAQVSDKDKELFVRSLLQPVIKVLTAKRHIPIYFYKSMRFGHGLSVQSTDLVLFRAVMDRHIRVDPRLSKFKDFWFLTHGSDLKHVVYADSLNNVANDPSAFTRHAEDLVQTAPLDMFNIDIGRVDRSASWIDADYSLFPSGYYENAKLTGIIHGFQDAAKLFIGQPEYAKSRVREDMLCHVYDYGGFKYTSSDKYRKATGLVTLQVYSMYKYIVCGHDGNRTEDFSIRKLFATNNHIDDQFIVSTRK